MNVDRRGDAYDRTRKNAQTTVAEILNELPVAMAKSRLQGVPVPLAGSETGLLVRCDQFGVVHHIGEHDRCQVPCELTHRRGPFDEG